MGGRNLMRSHPYMKRYRQLIVADRRRITFLQEQDPRNIIQPQVVIHRHMYIWATLNELSKQNIYYIYNIQILNMLEYMFLLIHVKHTHIYMYVTHILVCIYVTYKYIKQQLNEKMKWTWERTRGEDHGKGWREEREGWEWCNYNFK